jgi:hypothetical protein
MAGTANKKSVESVVAELRVLNSAVEETPVDAGILGWFTPDFWATAVTAVGNIIAVAAILGWVDKTSVDGLTVAVTAVIGAAEVIVTNSLLIWKYLAARQEFRLRIMDKKFAYMEAVAVEKIRSGK